MSTLEVRSRRGAIQIHVNLYLLAIKGSIVQRGDLKTYLFAGHSKR